jgi:hypothetical protein
VVQMDRVQWKVSKQSIVGGNQIGEEHLPCHTPRHARNHGFVVEGSLVRDSRWDLSGLRIVGTETAQTESLLVYVQQTKTQLRPMMQVACLRLSALCSPRRLEPTSSTFGALLERHRRPIRPPWPTNSPPSTRGMPSRIQRVRPSRQRL